MVSPLLGRRRGPNECQVVDDTPHRIALVHHEQPRHRETFFDSGKGWGGHGVHVVRDDDEAFLGRIFQYLGIWTFIEAHLPYANPSNTRLTAENAIDDVLVEIVISQELRPTHDSPETSAFCTARSRSTTGLCRSVLLARQ